MSEEVDFNKIVKAHVHLRGQFAGTLEKGPDKKFRFQYNKEYLRGGLPLATSLPLGEDHKADSLPPFFDNLIPEGWLLQYAEKSFHIDKSNRFALLMATGRYPIGAVTMHPLLPSGEKIDMEKIWDLPHERESLELYPNKPLPNFTSCPSCFKPLSPHQVHTICTTEMWGTQKKLRVELHPTDPARPFYNTIHGGSISGAQKKGLFRLSSKGHLIPTPKEAQYILKPKGSFNELPENEHVTMAIAKKTGFEVPPFSVLHMDNMGVVFAIKRFDRSNDKPLMVEDMAQVTQLHSDNKYDSSCERVAKCIKQLSSAPQIDLTKFYRRIIFCYFIANGDMHLKNWSLLENPKAEGQWKLSPCYDLLNTRLAIEKESHDIGLLLNGKSRKLRKGDFQKFGQSLSLTARATEKPFSELDHWWDVTKDLVNKCLLSQSSKKRYLEIVKQRYNVLKNNLA